MRPTAWVEGVGGVGHTRNCITVEVSVFRFQVLLSIFLFSDT